MAILANNAKLIKVGQDYSAGSGISIYDHTISVTGEFGHTYSAGDNISIYNQGEQLYISSKDWNNDIANASANAYNKAIAQIPAPFNPDYISAQVDNKLDTTAFTNWQNGQYSTDLQTIEGQIANKQDALNFRYGTSSGSISSINGSAIIDDYTYHMLKVTRVSTANLHKTLNSNSGTWNSVTNKLDTTAFSTVSGDFLTAINIPESATWNEVSQVYEQASATYLTSVNIPESAVWQDVSTTVQSNSSQWAEGGGVTGNYIPYTATDTGPFPKFETNSGLAIRATNDGGVNSTFIDPSIIQVSYRYSTSDLSTVDLRSVLSNSKLTFNGKSNSAYVDIEKINTWDSASNYIQSNSSSLTDVSTTVQSNSAQWAGGVTGEFVPQSAFNELKSSYDALSSLFATYSGQWLLPNEGV